MATSTTTQSSSDRSARSTASVFDAVLAGLELSIQTPRSRSGWSPSTASGKMLGDNSPAITSSPVGENFWPGELPQKRLQPAMQLVGAFAAKAPGQHDQELFEVGVERRIDALLDAEFDANDHGLCRRHHGDAALDVFNRNFRRGSPRLHRDIQQRLLHLVETDRVLADEVMVDRIATGPASPTARPAGTHRRPGEPRDADRPSRPSPTGADRPRSACVPGPCGSD